MEPEQAPDQLENDTNTRHGGAGKWIAIVVILTVIAVLLVPGQEDSDKSREPLPPVERPSLLAPADTQQTEPPSEPASNSGNTTKSSQDGDDALARDTGPGAAGRRLIREAQANPPLDLEAIWHQARRFEEGGQLDDAYLLYYFAARQGHGPAAMKLAREADPTAFEPGGLFEKPDELQAHKWYAIAARAGIKEAEAALQVLRVRVEKAATNGDERARGLMLLWK